jgi:hypothetical protein
MIIILNLHSETKLSGWLRHCLLTRNPFNSWSLLSNILSGWQIRLRRNACPYRNSPLNMSTVGGLKIKVLRLPYWCASVGLLYTSAQKAPLSNLTEHVKKRNHLITYIPCVFNILSWKEFKRSKKLFSSPSCKQIYFDMTAYNISAWHQSPLKSYTEILEIKLKEYKQDFDITLVNTKTRCFLHGRIKKM